MEKGKYNPYDEGVEVIQDDDKVKIVKVLTLNAAQYFGSDYFYGNDNWSRHYRDGDLYFIISKKDDSLYSIFNDEDGSVIRNVNQGNIIKTIDDLKQSFLSSLKVLSPLIKGGKTYEFLKKISKGYDPGWRDDGDDPLISQIKFNDTNPGSSKVIIVIDDDEVFLDTINVDSSEDIYAYRSFTGYYSDSDYDTYHETDRWKNGEFIEYNFSDENKRKAFQIARYYDNGIKSDDYEGISKILDDSFEYVVADLIFEYVSTWQDCIDDVVKNIILDEVAKPFDKFGIKEINRGNKFESSVNVLLHWYYDVGNYKFTLSELLNKLIKLYDKKDRGWWNELEYEVDCADWDDNAIQSYYSKRLDSMLEKIQEDDRFIDVDEYNQIRDYVEKEYGYSWVQTKKDPNISFMIGEVQPETNKVLVNVHNSKTDSQHQRLLDIDGLYQLNNQPELFTERRIIRKKFL
jgi:hypothetical protein